MNGILFVQRWRVQRQLTGTKTMIHRTTLDFGLATDSVATKDPTTTTMTIMTIIVMAITSLGPLLNGTATVKVIRRWTETCATDLS
jgi:hypothetical protein